MLWPWSATQNTGTTACQSEIRQKSSGDDKRVVKGDLWRNYKSFGFWDRLVMLCLHPCSGYWSFLVVFYLLFNTICCRLAVCLKSIAFGRNVTTRLPFPENKHPYFHTAVFSCLIRLTKGNPLLLIQRLFCVHRIA